MSDDLAAEAEVYQAGYEAALADIGVADLAHVPVTLRWRHVQPGHVIVGADGLLFMVTGAGEDGGQWRLDITRGWLGISSYMGDPDDTAKVLMTRAERDAMTLCRDQLGARVIATAAP